MKCLHEIPAALMKYLELWYNGGGAHNNLMFQIQQVAPDACQVNEAPNMP